MQALSKSKRQNIIDVPKDWQLCPLIEFVDGRNDIVAGPFGSNLKVSDYKTDGVPIIRLQNIERNRFINENIRFISPEKAEELKYHSYQPNDIVLAKLGDPIGKTCMIPESVRGGIVVADVVRIRPSKNTDTKFLEYLLNSDFCSKQMNGNYIGTTRPRVNLDHIRYMKVFKPPLKEQQNIASILSKLDELIQKTDDIIQQTQKLKKGLMQKLLTKGIGHTKFKAAEFSSRYLKYEIPEEWKIDTIKNLSEKLVVSFVGTCDPFYTDENGVPMIRTTNVREGYLDLSNLKYVTREFHEKNKKSQLRLNDLLIARHGESGASCLFQGLSEANALSVVIVRPDRTKWLPEFFELAFNSSIVRSQINRNTAGGVQTVINTSEVGKALIFLPSLQEQKDILSTELVLRKDLSNLQIYKKDILLLKKGLMQQLLTGKIRVRV